VILDVLPLSFQNVVSFLTPSLLIHIVKWRKGKGTIYY
jgi:hypothetical protein